jgi:hypothetical protein
LAAFFQRFESMHWSQCVKLIKLFRHATENTSLPACHTDYSPFEATLGTRTMRVIRITTSDARTNGLPPVDISLDYSNTSLLATVFPRHGVYVQLSGPPGGPLGVSIEAAEPYDLALSLEALIRQRFNHPADEPLVFGRQGEIELSAVRHKSLTFVSGSSHAKSVHVVTIIRGTNDTALLVDFHVGGSQPDSTVVTGHPDLMQVARTLAVRFED